MSLMFIEDVIIFSGHTSILLFYVYFNQNKNNQRPLVTSNFPWVHRVP